jgi:ribosomal protein L40E
VSDERCRACGAAVPPAAQWCSLCYADLREPVPVREPVTVPETPSAPLDAAVLAPTVVQAVQPQAPSVPSPAEPAADPITSPSEGKHAAAVGDTLGWPCPRCGAQVPISLDACNSCGERFLAGATSATVRVPVLGDVGALSRTQRLMFGAGIAIAVMVVLVLLATLAVKLF